MSVKGTICTLTQTHMHKHKPIHAHNHTQAYVCSHRGMHKHTCMQTYVPLNVYTQISELKLPEKTSLRHPRPQVFPGGAPGKELLAVPAPSLQEGRPQGSSSTELLQKVLAQDHLMSSQPWHLARQRTGIRPPEKFSLKGFSMSFLIQLVISHFSLASRLYLCANPVVPSRGRCILSPHSSSFCKVTATAIKPQEQRLCCPLSWALGAAHTEAFCFPLGEGESQVIKTQRQMLVSSQFPCGALRFPSSFPKV